MKQSELAPPSHMISDHPANPSHSLVSVLQKVNVCEGILYNLLLRLELSEAVLQNLSPGLFFQLLEFSASARIA